MPPLQQMFFEPNPSLPKHVELCMTQPQEYWQELEMICDNQEIVHKLSQPTKAIILATLHMMGQHHFVALFLKHCDVVAIVKACQILDRPRFMKQLEQKIAKIEYAHPSTILEETNDEDEEEQKKNLSDKKRGPFRKYGRQGKRRRDHPIEEGQDQNVERKKKHKRKRKIDIYRAESKLAKSLLFHNSGSREIHCEHTRNLSAVKEIIASASLSGAFAKKVRRWASTLKRDFLEFIVLSGSMDVWKELADWVHFTPRDFTLPYFLSAVHGEAVPEGSFVQGMQHLLSDQLQEDEDELSKYFTQFATEYPQLYNAYNFLRMHPHLLRNQKIARLLATNIPISTVIWYLEEIAVSDPGEIPRIVARRFQNPPEENGASSWMETDPKSCSSSNHTKVTESFGKLAERILTFQSRGWYEVADCLKPAATRRLSALQEKWAGTTTSSDHNNNNNNNKEGLTVILGDKSASMQSAIEAATIISAMVSTCFQGELIFFDVNPVPSPYKRPSTVDHVLQIARTIRAGNGTSMAAALWPYYQTKTKLARIILVSDEGENTPYNSFLLAPLLQTYQAEVHRDVELISICVGSGSWFFRQSFAAASIEYKRIEIDGYRPDLSKFDSLLGQIALLSRSTKKETRRKEDEKEDAANLNSSAAAAVADEEANDYVVI